MKVVALLNILFCCLLISACSSKKKNIRLYVLDGGEIKARDASVLGLDSVPLTLSNNIYLIHHPEGYLLWDTGLPDHYLDSADGVDNPLSTEIVTKTVKSQLDELGIHPSTIDYVALSHAHTDHTGNAHLFEHAQWLIQQAEYQLAVSDSAAKYFINPSSFAQIKDIHTIDNQDYDVFGDGSVVLKYTPGHTVGHQSLFVKLSNYGNVLISGDLYHHPLNRKNKKFPVFNFDMAQTQKSAESIEHFMSKTNAQLWIQHAPKNDSIRFSPNHYD